MSLIRPDRYLTRISQLDPERDLLARGLTHAFLDIDNTLLRRDTHEVPPDVLEWLDAARAAGVALCLVSNNCHESVHVLAAELGLPIRAKAMKPLPFAFLAALRQMGAERKHSVVIGDQLLTDILGAHLTGMQGYLVMPLVEKDLRHTVVVRKFERKLLGKMRPEPLPCALAQRVEAEEAARLAGLDEGSVMLEDADAEREGQGVSRDE